MKYLVIGNGLIGSALTVHLADMGRTVRMTTRTCIDLDAEEPILQSIGGWDVAFITAFLTGFRRCEEAPALAFRINVHGISVLAKRLVGLGTRVILLSSSAVESKIETVYGGTSALAEMIVLRHGLKASVLRFGPVMQPERATYADGRYHPVRLTDVNNSLVAMADSYAHGLHYLFSSEQFMRAA